MLRKSNQKLAIDIGSSSIKVCLISVGRGYSRLESLAEIPTPPDSVREGTAIAPDLVGTAIRSYLQSQQIRTKTATITVGGPQVVARPVRLPPMPIETLHKSIRYEANRYLPTTSEDHYVGFEVLAEIGDQMEVLIVAAPRDLVESRVQSLYHAGLEAELVEIEAFALQRAIALVQSDFNSPEHALALIDLGGTHTQVSVVRGETLALTRFIPIAGETLTAALAGYFHYTPEEIVPIKAGLHLTELLQKNADPQENPPLRLLQPILDELIREIRRSLNYYQTQMSEEGSKSGRVAKLLLTGGTALMNGVADYFHHKLNINAEVVNPLRSPLLDTSLLHPEQIDRGPVYATVLGSATALSTELAEAA